MPEILPRPGEADAAATSPHRPGSSAAGDRFAAHVGVTVHHQGGTPCECGATATLTEPPAWARTPATDADGTGTDADDGAAVPTGAVLALVDAAARGAAEAALSGHGGPAALVPVATGVQYRTRPVGSLTATATVPCEGELTDRADPRGVLRFSVAVTVLDRHGDRTATGTVQWVATLVPPDATGAGAPSGASAATDSSAPGGPQVERPTPPA